MYPWQPIKLLEAFHQNIMFCSLVTKECLLGVKGSTQVQMSDSVLTAATFELFLTSTDTGVNDCNLIVLVAYRTRIVETSNTIIIIENCIHKNIITHYDAKHNKN